MPDYPTLDKSWQFNVNQALAAQGTALACAQNILYQIVVSMMGFASNPWQVRGCSTSTSSSLLALTAVGPGTGWGSASAVVFSSSSSVAHSWIVLRNTSLGSGYPEI